MMKLELIRIAFGTLELTRPALVARALGTSSADNGTEALARVLGVRHIVQGLLTLRAGRTAHHVGGAVDLTHAASMGAVAAVSSNHRNAASLSALIALVFASNELR
jgi:hypothetical protein